MDSRKAEVIKLQLLKGLFLKEAIYLFFLKAIYYNIRLYGYTNPTENQSSAHANSCLNSGTP